MSDWFPIHILLFVLLALTGCSRTSDTAASGSPVVKEVSSDSAATAGNSTDSPWRIHGRVHFTDSSPVGSVDVATNWSANGQQWNDDGTFPSLKLAEAVTEYWNDEGEMEPRPNSQAATVKNGVFEILVSNNKTSPRVVLAMNKERTQGGLAFASPGGSDPLAIQFKPLVRMQGEIRYDGKIPEWSFACVFPAHLKNVPD